MQDNQPELVAALRRLASRYRAQARHPLLRTDRAHFRALAEAALEFADELEARVRASPDPDPSTHPIPASSDSPTRP